MITAHNFFLAVQRLLPSLRGENFKPLRSFEC